MHVMCMPIGSHAFCGFYRILPLFDNTCTVFIIYMVHKSRVKRGGCDCIFKSCAYVLKEVMYCETSKRVNGACIVKHPEKENGACIL